MKFNTLLILIIALSIFSCKKNVEEGFYIENESSKIYSFKRNHFIIYNLIDSTSIIKKNRLLSKEYSIIDSTNDSILIVNFLENGKYSYLKKINFHNNFDFSLNENWFIKSTIVLIVFFIMRVLTICIVHMKLK
ncbi:hypothetical protein BTO06_03605 [Tenacibaculum sp. SZ-18]|nr:hypothetical protein BTO06_03605 [Tenacibaculum sp. SZ-18]